MGLTGLRGGGVVGQASTAISTSQVHTLGTVAVDSSGGEYIYLRGFTGSPNLSARGTWVLLQTSEFGQPVSMSTGPTLGSALGISQSTNGSSANFGWYQTYGPGSALIDSSGAAAGSRLYVSAGSSGYASISSGPHKIDGAAITSSGTSSLANVFLNYPVVATT